MIENKCSGRRASGAGGAGYFTAFRILYFSKIDNVVGGAGGHCGCARSCVCPGRVVPARHFACFVPGGLGVRACRLCSRARIRPPASAIRPAHLTLHALHARLSLLFRLGQPPSHTRPARPPLPPTVGWKLVAPPAPLLRLPLHL